MKKIKNCRVRTALYDCRGGRDRQLECSEELAAITADNINAIIDRSMKLRSCATNAIPAVYGILGEELGQKIRIECYMDLDSLSYLDVTYNVFEA